jgi:signal transduction histidine kinase
VEEVAAARVELAMSAVAAERLRIAEEVGDGVGVGLAAVGRVSADARAIDVAVGAARTALDAVRRASVEFRSLSLGPEAAAARALLEAAGIGVEVRLGHAEPLGAAGGLLAEVLREAVTDVVRAGRARRCVISTLERDGQVVLGVRNDGVTTADLGAASLDGVIRRVRAAGGQVTVGLGADGWFGVEASVVATPVPVAAPDRSAHRFAVGLLALVLAGFCGKALLLVEPGPAVVLAVVPLAVIVMVQLRVTTVRWWALVLQAVLSYLPLVWFGTVWIGVPGFLAGSLLVALPRWVALPLVAGVSAGAAGIAVGLGESAAVAVNYGISVPVTGLVVFGLVRLARLVEQLQAAGAELARAAVVQERLRAARDLHDLLGHSLAAVLLKCELAKRLLESDPARAEAELADVKRMAEQAQADMRAVAGGPAEMSFADELNSARSVLIAAGIEAETDVPDEPLPAGVGTTLSAVLREAVTNVLRHSAAERCRIGVALEPTAVRLTVANDGIARDAPVRPSGAGIGNLSTRVAAAGGRLAFTSEDGEFRLVAVLPLQPAGLGGDADGVGAVAGVQLGDDRGQVVADRSSG